MIVFMQPGTLEDSDEVRAVKNRAISIGLKPEVRETQGEHYAIVEIYMIDGESVHTAAVADHVFEMSGVAKIIRVTPPQVSLFHGGTHARELRLSPSIVVGNGTPCQVVLGPCTVDEHIDTVVMSLVEHGIKMIRGGCWKPRSNAGSFPGHGERGLRWLLAAAKKYGVEVVFTEVMESNHIDVVRRVKKETGFTGTVVLWVGARTQNTILLEALGAQRESPVMLKNSANAVGVDDLYNRASWVLSGPKVWEKDGSLDRGASLAPGNDRLMLCLRGIEKRDKGADHRFDQNVDWIRTLRRAKVWTPICVDPSHSAGRRDLVFDHLAFALQYQPHLIMIEGGYLEANMGLCDQAQMLPIGDIPRILEMVRVHNETRTK